MLIFDWSLRDGKVGTVFLGRGRGALYRFFLYWCSALGMVGGRWQIWHGSCKPGML